MKRSVLALLSACALACDGGEPLTQLLVVVDTDLAIGTEIDAVTVEVTGMQSASGSLVGSSADPLPRTVGLVWTGTSLGPITVRAVGTLAGAEVVERVTVTSFLEGRTLVLPMFLSRACRGRGCPDNQTCTLGSCASAEVDPSTLAEHEEGPLPRFDGGMCEIDVEACNGRDDDCDGMIDEAFDLDTDPLNCGGCMNVCARPNALVGCADRACTVTGCEDGFGNCDDNPANGCEDDLSTAAHCGACGNACTFPNGTAACEAGGCVLTGCLDGFDDCNADPADGCETSLRTLTDCGSCGTACAVAGATATCATGSCALETCDDGLGDCNADAADGCEQPLDTLVHCGGCDVACDLPNGTETCATRACEVETCDALFDDCNGVASDGCEQTLTTLTDCGACDTACSVTQGTATCATGACAVATCNTNFGDCNDDPLDGCETETRRDPMNCGTCGIVCMAPTDMCMNGACR